MNGYTKEDVKKSLKEYISSVLMEKYAGRTTVTQANLLQMTYDADEILYGLGVPLKTKFGCKDDGVYFYFEDLE